jgi:dipeptidase
MPHLGGTCWFGFDDTYFTVYLPVYLKIKETPEAYRIGDIRQYDPSSMWWAMNFVSNYANLKYSYMIKDIQKLQEQLEDRMIKEQDSLIMRYFNKMIEDKEEVLQNYVNEKAELILEKWNQLAYKLIAKYNDGYIKPDSGGMLSPGYPQEWLDVVLEKEGKAHKLPEWNKQGP